MEEDGDARNFEKQLTELQNEIQMELKIIEENKRRRTLKQWFRDKSVLIQLILSVAVAAFAICSLCIAAWAANMSWLRTEIHKQLDHLAEDDVRGHWVDLAKSLKQRYDVEYDIAYQDHMFLKLFLERAIADQSIAQNPFPAVWHDELTSEMVERSPKHGDRRVSFETATIYSPEDPQTVPTKLMGFNIGMLGILIRDFYRQRIRYVYIGFEQGDILMQYPGEFQGQDYEYYVTVEDWYNLAWSEPDVVYQEEPQHTEDKKAFNYIISSVIEDYDGSKYAVLATDWISEIPRAFDQVRIMDSGFLALVSKSGRILNKPRVWVDQEQTPGLSEAQDYKIYTTAVTGMDLPMWREMLDETLSDDKLWDVSIPYQTSKYFIARSYIRSNSGDVIYVILVGGSIDEAQNSTTNIDLSYNESFWQIMGNVLGICITTMITIFVMVWWIYQKNIKAGLRRIKQFLKSIILNGACTDLLLKLDYDEAAVEQDTPNEVDQFENKFMDVIDQLDKLENKYTHPDAAVSRPVDLFNYMYWDLVEAPLNKMRGKPMVWKSAIKELKDY